jgi:hypothetical protein
LTAGDRRDVLWREWFSERPGVVLLTILKWILQAVLVALKLVLGIAKLFLLLLALVMRIVLTMIGVSVSRQ